MRRRPDVKWRGPAVVVAALAVAAMACSSSGGGDSSDAPSPGIGAGGAARPVEGAIAEPSRVPQGQPVDAEQAIVYTAEVRVRVGDRDQAASEAIAKAEDAGGLLFSEESRILSE